MKKKNKKPFEPLEHILNVEGKEPGTPKGMLHWFSDQPGIFFGRPNGRKSSQTYVGRPVEQDGHVLLIGQSGSGKTEACIKPSLATWTSSKIIMDVKGDLASCWEEIYHGTDRQLIHFDPSAQGDNPCRYDPFFEIKNNGVDEAISNMRNLTFALLPPSPSVTEKIWVEMARDYLTASLLYFYHIDTEFVDAITEIIRTPIKELRDKVMRSEIKDAEIFMSKLCDMPGKSIRCIGAELSALDPIIADPFIREALTPIPGCPTLEWDQFTRSTQPMDVILSFPEEKLEAWEPMLRLLLNQMTTALLRRPRRRYEDSDLPPLLVLLDEFPRLGCIPAIKNGLSTLRSRGVTYLLAIQSIAQLDDLYGHYVARILLDNCPYKVILGATDVESQRFCSDLVGSHLTYSHAASTFAIDTGESTGRYSLQISENHEPWIYPHEFGHLENVIVVAPAGTFTAKKTLFALEHEFFFPGQNAEQAVFFYRGWSL